MEIEQKKTIGSDSLYSDGTLISKGLTKREYFASMALQGILANSYLIPEIEHQTKFAVKYADALIEALNT
jgi:hypothetical protein